MIWRTPALEFDLSTRALIMGVLNVTLNSFSDGGKFVTVNSALVHARAMAAEGARVIDIGGESTRPGAEPVPEQIEKERVLPVVEAVAKIPGVVVSIDTSKASVARAAMELGAAIVNDVTGLRGDPMMIEVVKETGAGVVVMHMQGSPRDMQIQPRYDDVVGEIREFFRQSFERVLASGIDPTRVVFDPGIGFGKTVAHNLQLLKNFEALRVSDRPLAVGVSRKSFIGKLVETDDIPRRDAATAALTAMLRGKGANIFRVHAVRPNSDALRLAEAILAS
ncbi:MAG: dihydropteroate synthase [Verrucomicrobiota bacterium]|nr:dihydropteroate synthase [Verrucomicrobiota bacterium]